MYIYIYFFVGVCTEENSISAKQLCVAIAAIYLVPDPVTMRWNLIEHDGEWERLTTSLTIAHQWMRLIIKGASSCQFDVLFSLLYYALVCLCLFIYLFAFN